MTTFRFGILGAANFALGHMAPAIHAAKNVELYALATSSADKAVPFAAINPALKVHTSYEALLADPMVDAVYIPLPNHLHVEWTHKALAAGKHVLTEKPIAMQANEIDALITARDAAGKLAAEAYMITHHPQWQRAKAWIEAGEIGAVRHVDAAFSFHLLDTDNIRNRPETGGGSLRDIGVYTFGSMRFVTGAEPVDLTARIVREGGIDSFAQISAVMQGPQGRFTYGSMTSMRLYNRQTVVFQGDKGMVRLDGGPFNANVNDLSSVELHRAGNSVLTERFPAANQYVLQVEAFARAAQGGTDYFPSLEFVKGTQAMIDWAFRDGIEIAL